MSVATLCPSEPVFFDSAPLHALIQQVGPRTAEDVADTTVEEIISLLVMVEAAWSTAEFARMRQHAVTLDAMASRIGMTTVARVARSVIDLSNIRDCVALSATVARLVRVGDASMASLGDVADSV